MNKIYRLYENLVPPFLQKPLLSTIYTLSDCIHLPKDISYNFSLKNSSISESACILATGPSLKDHDLSFLKNVDCYSVSNFFLHPQLNAIRPLIHFFAPYHKPLLIDNFVEWLRKAHIILPSSTKICLGVRDKQIVEKFNLFEGRSIYYLKLGKAPSYSIFDPTKTVLAPYTSPIMILPLLLYMGYKKVFLLGCDNNTLKNYKGSISNFYSPDKEIRLNATSGDKWDRGIMNELIEQLAQFKQYDFYNKFYSKMNTKLYNCSNDSWIDFIEYMPLEKLKDQLQISSR